MSLPNINLYCCIDIVHSNMGRVVRFDKWQEFLGGGVASSELWTSPGKTPAQEMSTMTECQPPGMSNVYNIHFKDDQYSSVSLDGIIRHQLMSFI